MTAKEAVAKCVLQLCDQQGLTVNSLANQAGVSPSTIYSMLNEKSKNPGTVTLQRLCAGWGITLRGFFDCDIFDHIEQEIQ